MGRQSGNVQNLSYHGCLAYLPWAGKHLNEPAWFFYPLLYSLADWPLKHTITA
jgi:hypothetical protein